MKIIKEDLWLEPRICENQFFMTIFLFLSQRGLHQIDMDELSKKLFMYYQNKDFEPLFKDIVGFAEQQRVYINDWLRHGFRSLESDGYVTLEGKTFHLNFPSNFETSILEIFNPISLQILQQIADDIVLQSKLETSKLHIYSCNPNKKYELIQGIRDYVCHESEIITDGQIDKSSTSPIDYFNNCYDPVSAQSMCSFNSGSRKEVSIKDASYVIIQASCHRQLKRMEIYTEIAEIEKLRELACYASKMEEKYILLEDTEPFVKKICSKGIPKII